MGKAGAARRLAAAAAYGGGGLSVLGTGLYGLLRLEAALARRSIGEAKDDPFNATGWYGRGRPGPTIHVALLGDSSAAGYGVQRIVDTPGAMLATGIASAAGRRVHLVEVAKVGAQSSDLDGQIDRVLPESGPRPDVAVVLVGANDVTHGVLPQQSVRHLTDGVRRLVEAGVQVVVGTCPDLGTLRPVPPPLRQVARQWSRRLAAAQTIAVVDSGGVTVSLGSILGPDFEREPGVFFGPDRFHPSADGYRALVDVMLPSVLASLGFAEARTPGRERSMTVARAAVEAVRTPGTELGGTEASGARRGVRGLRVELRHRRRRAAPDTEAPESQAPDAELRGDAAETGLAEG